MTLGTTRILHVLRSPRAEGTVRLAIDLMRTGIVRHELLVLEAQPADCVEELRHASDWTLIKAKLPPGMAKFPWMVWVVWKTCRQRRPDVVICWPNGFGACVLLGAACAGVRGLITHAGNPPTATGFGRAHTLLTAGFVWALGGRMICCSRYVADRFTHTARAFSSVFRVVYNCAPLSEIGSAAGAERARRSDWSPRLIMVATLEAHKDHATLLRAMPEVVRAAPGARLWLVGDGSLRKGLERLRDELGLAEAVAFLGSRQDVPALLGQCDIFVFSTTEQEGLGTVLIEAMAAGLAIVASDVPACREVLAGGQWGKLAPAGDCHALAGALIESILSRPNADSASRREALQQYLPDRMMSAYLSAVP